MNIMAMSAIGTNQNSQITKNNSKMNNGGYASNNLAPLKADTVSFTGGTNSVYEILNNVRPILVAKTIKANETLLEIANKGQDFVFGDFALRLGEAKNVLKKVKELNKQLNIEHVLNSRDRQVMFDDYAGEFVKYLEELTPETKNDRIAFSHRFGEKAGVVIRFLDRFPEGGQIDKIAKNGLSEENLKAIFNGKADVFKEFQKSIDGIESLKKYFNS